MITWALDWWSCSFSLTATPQSIDRLAKASSFRSHMTNIKANSIRLSVIEDRIQSTRLPLRTTIPLRVPKLENLWPLWVPEWLDLPLKVPSIAAQRLRYNARLFVSNQLYRPGPKPILPEWLILGIGMGLSHRIIMLNEYCVCSTDVVSFLVLFLKWQ